MKQLLAQDLPGVAARGFLVARHLEVRAEMARLGLPPLGAEQALPGILGCDGWLARSPFASWCAAVPGLVDAPRPVVHFARNAGEMVVLLAVTMRWRGLARLGGDGP